jgi:transposase, IS30 family
VILIHVPKGQPTAEAMRDGITDALGVLAPHLRRTLTWDQGKELCAASTDHRAHRDTRVLL